MEELIEKMQVKIIQRSTTQLGYHPKYLFLDSKDFKSLRRHVISNCNLKSSKDSQTYFMETRVLRSKDLERGEVVLSEENQ